MTNTRRELAEALDLLVRFSNRVDDGFIQDLRDASKRSGTLDGGEAARALRKVNSLVRDLYGTADTLCAVVERWEQRRSA